MRCRTTHAFGRGAVSRPPRNTRPLMLTWGVCAASIDKAPTPPSPPPPPPPSNRKLRREPPQVFRIRILGGRLEGGGGQEKGRGGWRGRGEGGRRGTRE